MDDMTFRGLLVLTSAIFGLSSVVHLESEKVSAGDSLPPRSRTFVLLDDHHVPYRSVDELSPGQNAMLYSLGFVICTGSLHGIGIGMGLAHRWPLGRLALRGAGSLVMAGGLYFLWGAMA